MIRELGNPVLAANLAVCGQFFLGPQNAEHFLFKQLIIVEI